MTENISVLSVGAHRKDPIIHSGGTLAKHVARGDKVSVLSVTHGVRTHHLRARDRMQKESSYNPDIEELIQEIENELVAACGEIGVNDVRCLRHDDEILSVNPEIVKDIADVICEVKPDIVITHWPEDGHLAHGYTGQMTSMAVVAADSLRSDMSNKPHRINSLYYHVPVLQTTMIDTISPKPITTYVDITEVIQMKFKALNHFAHQFYGGEDPVNRAEIERLDGLYGLAAKVPYVEPYVLHKPAVFEHLPLSKYEMKISNSSQEEEFGYSGQMLLDV